MSTESPSTLPQLTWIRYYRGPSERHDDFARLLRDNVQRAAGSGWGVAVPLSHNDDPWTHMVWVDLASWAAVEALVVAMDGVERGSVLRDGAFRRIVQGEARSTVTPRYVVMAMHWIRRGDDDDALVLFNDWAKPVFTELTATGQVGDWSLLVEEFVISGSWRYMTWYPISDIGALDAVVASLMNFGLARLKSFEQRLNLMSTEQFYRGQIARVLYSS